MQSTCTAVRTTAAAKPLSTKTSTKARRTVSFKEPTQELSDGRAAICRDSPSVANVTDASGGDLSQCGPASELCQDKPAPVADCTEVAHQTVGNNTADLEHVDDEAAHKESSIRSEPAEAEVCVPHPQPHAQEGCPAAACDSGSFTPGECVEAPASVDGRSASQADVHHDIGFDDGHTELGELDGLDGNSAEEIGTPGPQRENLESAAPLEEEARTPVLAAAAGVASVLEDGLVPGESAACSELAHDDPSSSDATQGMASSGESEMAFGIKQATQELSEGIAERAAESDGVGPPSITNAADVSIGPDQQDSEFSVILQDSLPAACDEAFEERLSGSDGDVLVRGQDLELCQDKMSECAEVAHPTVGSIAADLEHIDDGAACSSESGRKQQELQLTPGVCVEAPASSQADVHHDIGLDDGHTELGDLDGLDVKSAEEIGTPGPQRENRESATPSTDALEEEARTPVLAAAAGVATVLEDEQVPGESAASSELANDGPSIAAPTLPASVPSDYEVTDATQGMASSGESEMAFGIKQAAQELSEGIAESAAESDGVGPPSITNAADVSIGPDQQDSEFSVILQDSLPAACDEAFEERLSGSDGDVLVRGQDLELCQDKMSECAEVAHPTVGSIAADLEHIDDGAAWKDSIDSSMDSEAAEAELCIPHAESHALGECPVEACDSASESGKKQQELQLTPGVCVEAPASSQADVHHDIGLDDGHTELGELDGLDGNSAEEIGTLGPQREDRESATPSTDALEEEARTPVLAAAAGVASVLEDEQVPGESAASSELANDGPSIAAPTLPASVPSDYEVTDATQGMASSGESEMAFGIKQAAQELSEGIAESAAESDGVGPPSITNAADVSIGPDQQDSEFSVILQDSLPAACDEAFEERLSGSDGDVLVRGQDLELCQDKMSECAEVAHPTVGKVAADLEHIDDGAAWKDSIDSSMDSEAAEAELCIPHAESHALGECPVEACDSASESGKKQQELQLTPGECVEAPASVDGRSASQADVHHDIGFDDGHTELGELDDFDGNSAEEIGNPGSQREDCESATPSTDALEEEARTPVLAAAAGVASVLEDEQVPGESAACSELPNDDSGRSDLDFGIAAPTLPASVASDCEVTDATQGMASSGESEMAFGIKQAAQELSEGIAGSAAESDGVGPPSITNAADVSIGPDQQDSEFSVILKDSLPAACDEAFEERLSGSDGDVLVRGQDLELCPSPVSDCTEVAHSMFGNMVADMEHVDDGAARKESSMDSEVPEAELSVPHGEPHDSASESDKKQQELQLTPGECVKASASVDGRSTSPADVHDIGFDDGHTELGELDGLDGNSAEEIGNPGSQREDRESATPSTDALEEEARTSVLAAAAAVASVLEDEQVPSESAACSELPNDDPGRSDLDFGIAVPTLPASVPSDCEVTDATQGMASSGESEQAAQELSEGIAESAAESDGVGPPSITNAADVSIGPAACHADDAGGRRMKDGFSFVCHANVRCRFF